MHPADAMLFWAKLYPQRLAVLLPYMAITYQAMAAAIEAASARIQQLEFNSGEPVAVAIDDPAKLIVVCHALMRNGITCAPVLQNMVPLLPPHSIDTLIFAGESNVIVGGRNIRFDDSWLRNDNNSTATQKITPSDPSHYGGLVFFTSGTTGIPKKVIQSSAAFIERVRILPLTGEAAHNRVLISPGLASVFGFNRAATVLYAGKTVCFAYEPEAQLRVIKTFSIDVIVASVQQLLDILAVLERGATYRFDGLKEVWISGGYASDEVIRRLQLNLCRNVLNVYGSSEAGFVASAHYNMISHIPHAVGFVRPDMEIEIVDDTGNPVPAGKEGSVRGRSRFIAEVFAAQYPNRAPEAADTWWYPGDLGRLTADGILCITGRSDEVINMGGVKVAASLLDETVRAYPGINDAGTCAVLGPSGVDEVWIGVVPEAAIDLEALRTSIEQSQADTIKIGEILVVEQIPRTNLGKLQRHELKTLLLNTKTRDLSAP